MATNWIYERINMYDGYGRLVETKHDMTAADAADYAEGEGYDRVECIRYTPKARWIRCAYYIWSDKACGLVRVGTDVYVSHLKFVRARCDRDGIDPIHPDSCYITCPIRGHSWYSPKLGWDREAARKAFEFMYGNRV